MSNNSVKIEVYRWAGEWGPFRVNIPCGECSLTKDIIQDTIDNDLKGINVEVEVRDWLSEWWKPLMKGGWHAPIVLVDGKIVSQGRALNRGLLTEAVIESYAKKTTISNDENIIFGKETCPYCTLAKQYMDQAGINYTYYDVVKEPRALYEMIPRVKKIIGPKTPVTVPQIWVEGDYVGGSSELKTLLKFKAHRKPKRSHCNVTKLKTG